MTTNENGHLVDDAGNVVVDFVWGNFPLQPNDVRLENGGGILDGDLDNHDIAYSGWNGYPYYTPNTRGEDIVDDNTTYVLVPNVLLTDPAEAKRRLEDLGLVVTRTNNQAGGRATITNSYRAGGGGKTTITAAGHAFVVGDVVTVTGTNGNPQLEGTWTITNVATNTFQYQTVTSGTITSAPDTGLAVIAAKTGKVKAQNIAPAANGVEVGHAITITVYN
jgi:hypothetical protein